VADWKGSHHAKWTTAPLRTVGGTCLKTYRR
jgi:hypothetical protein